MNAKGTGGKPEPNRDKNERKGKGFIPRASRFEGANPDLKGHVFDLNVHGQVDKFPKTQEAIATYVGSNLDPDIGAHIRNLTSPDLVPPKRPTKEEMDDDAFLIEEYKLDY